MATAAGRGGEPLSDEQAIAELRQLIRPGTRDEPSLRAVTGVLRFDVPGLGALRVEVDRGRVTVGPGGGPADCTVRAGAADLLRILRGEQNFVTAVMQGRVEASGDLTLLQRFHGFTRAASAQEVHAP